MAKNIVYTLLKVKNLSRITHDRIIVRSYHPEMEKIPGVPLPLHDSDYFMFPERGQPLNLFLPDLSQLDYGDIKDEFMIKFNKTVVNSQRFLQRTSEIDIILFSNQAIQKARQVPNNILKNHNLMLNEGLISFEKLFAVEKLMVNVKEKLSDLSSKLSDLSNKLSDRKDISPQVTKVWEGVKEKLPAWQNSIATKLQQFQNRINNKGGTAKKEGGV